MSNTKIKVTDLDFYYGDFKALKNINIDIEENKVTAFIGPSGCGKSTFLRTLNRMNDLIDGTKVDGNIILDGKDIYSPHVEFYLEKGRSIIPQLGYVALPDEDYEKQLNDLKNI